MNQDEINKAKEVLLSNVKNMLDRDMFPQLTMSTKMFVGHKFDLIRDLNTTASVLLTAFVVLKKELVSTVWLFYIGIGCFVLLLVSNFLYRRLLVNFEEELLDCLDKDANDVMEKLKSCGKSNRIEECEALFKTVQEVIRRKHFEERKKSFFHKHGEKILFGLFMIGILSSICSILF